MNYLGLLDRKIAQAENLKSDVEILIADLKMSKQKTTEFLDCCAKYGIDKVAVGVVHDTVAGCKGWNHGSGMVFSNDVRFNGWSSIWRVCEELDISAGCGNWMQHQANTDRLVDGVYHCKDGKWIKIDEAA